MGVRSVIYWPNPLLMENAEEVPTDQLKSQAFKTLIQDMVDTCSYGHGVGLAAPQLGIMQQVILIPGSDNSPLILVNPKPFEAYPTVVFEEETEYCLSFPKIPVKVKRPTDIRITAQTVNGEFFTAVLSGIEARIAQHECDHLVGRTLANYASVTQRSMLRDKVKKNIRTARRIVEERTKEVSTLKKSISQDMIFDVQASGNPNAITP